MQLGQYCQNCGFIEIMLEESFWEYLPYAEDGCWPYCDLGCRAWTCIPYIEL